MKLRNQQNESPYGRRKTIQNFSYQSDSEPSHKLDRQYQNRGHGEDRNRQRENRKQNQTQDHRQHQRQKHIQGQSHDQNQDYRQNYRRDHKQNQKPYHRQDQRQNNRQDQSQEQRQGQTQDYRQNQGQDQRQDQRQADRQDQRQDHTQDQRQGSKSPHVSKSAGHNNKSYLERLREHNSTEDAVTSFNKQNPPTSVDTADHTGSITTTTINGNSETRLNLNHNNISSWAIRNVAEKDGPPLELDKAQSNPYFVHQIPERDAPRKRPHIDTPRCTTTVGRLPEGIAHNLETMFGGAVHNAQHSSIPHWPSSSTVHANVDATSSIHNDSNQMDSSKYSMT